jgi:hypothetical protein
MRKAIIPLLLASLFTLPLLAQDYPKAEVFGGYQYLHIGASDGSAGVGSNGWNGSATFNFNKHLGVAGDFSGAYKTEDTSIVGVPVSASTRVYSYAGGPVFSVDSGARINPFAHALFGGAHASAKACATLLSADCVSDSENGFTFMLGGGVDAKVNRALAVRLIQADWVYYHFSGVNGGPSSSQSNNVRISTGIVVRF